MSGESPEELLQRIRGGELDARRLLVTPDSAPGTADLTLEALLTAEPSVGELGERQWARLDADPGARIGDLDADHRFWIADLLDFWRTARRDVSQTISPLDGMYAKSPDSYFGPGAVALRCVRLAMLETRKDSCESLLDFACGYGRALRFFRAAFPDARLVACDISRDAVDFCAQEFGAAPVYSQEDPAAVELPGPFDVIWVGSLFTHVPEARWIALLDLLASALSQDGLLLFTVQGRNVRRQLLSGELAAWNLTDEGVAQIVRGYDDHGFGYADWSDVRGYGTSLNRPSWVTRQIEERPGLRLVGYREHAWGRQDVVTCQATGK
jgi:SAM-dependent methyltransferase